MTIWPSNNVSSPKSEQARTSPSDSSVSASETGIHGPEIGSSRLKSPLPIAALTSKPDARNGAPNVRPVCVFATARPDSAQAGQPIVLSPGPELPAEVTTTTFKLSKASKIGG